MSNSNFKYIKILIALLFTLSLVLSIFYLGQYEKDLEELTQDKEVDLNDKLHYN